ncbi:MAG: hypothetical protein JOZ39_03640 [Chloroflexi bacterium]|nr:hypothetical protein [Chloroflexota bacterium]
MAWRELCLFREGRTISEQPTTTDSIELQPFYYDAKETIVRPKQIVVGTRYFWERWAPRLGPTLSVLIVRLRMHCYYNQETQERRDWCFPTQQTLAEEIGVSRWTVMRELKRQEARQFVRVQYRSRYDPNRKQTVRISSLYHVAMDDPLIEEDRGRVAMLAAGRLLASAEERQDAHCGLTDPGRDVPERPFSGNEAKRLITQVATGPRVSNLPPKEKPEEILQDDDAAVARELVAEHISPKIAARLASSFPAERIREKMDLVKQLKGQQQQLRNAPGFLRKAIEDDYQQPLAATGTEDARPLLKVKTSLPTVTADQRATSQRAFQQFSPVAMSGKANNVDVWEATKQALATTMRPAAFEQWLGPSKLLRYELGRMCVVVPDTRVQRYLEQRLKTEIESSLRIACGGPTSFQVVVEGETASVTSDSDRGY